MIFNMSGGGGGSGELNFRVFDGQSAPAAPKYNDIWVKTSVKISDWEFSEVNMPSHAMAEGFVYFTSTYNGALAARESTGLNFLRKHAILTKLTAACQYYSGAWHSMDAYIYKSGTWVQFSSEKYVVFEAGKGLGAGLTGFSNATCNSNNIVAKNPLYAGHGNGDSVISKEKIDVTQYNTATFSGINCGFDGNGNANSSSIYAFVGGASTIIASATTSGGTTLASNKTVTVDISNVTGPVEFGFRTYSSAAYTVSFKNFNLNGIVFS